MWGLSLVYTAMLVVGKKPTFWFIDGNNLIASKGVTKDREALIQKMRPLQSSSAEQLVLVFDGRAGSEKNIDTEGSFQIVQLEEGVSSDDFILEEISKLVQESKINRVELVTADRELRRLALASRPGVKRVINPSTFWKRYLPRMSGLKKPEVDPSE